VLALVSHYGGGGGNGVDLASICNSMNEGGVK
jgi:hypothetical protein